MEGDRSVPCSGDPQLWSREGRGAAELQTPSQPHAAQPGADHLCGGPPAPCAQGTGWPRAGVTRLGAVPFEDEKQGLWRRPEATGAAASLVAWL